MKKTHLLVTVLGLSIIPATLIFMSKKSLAEEETIIPIATVNDINVYSQSSAKYIQLRHFVINRGKMNEFVEAWLKGVYPLRTRHGFKIEGAWIVKDKNEFFWILTYDGPETFDQKDSAYYASEGRNSLNPDPAQYIAKSEKYFLKQLLPQ